MTENQPPIGPSLNSLLSGLSKSAKKERHGSESFQAMSNAESVGQVARRVRDGHTNLALDAFDVLTEKFGLPSTPELYAYLAELPHRFRTYEAAFREETHVGCVDRAAVKCTEEINQAAGVTKRPLFGISTSASHAALLVGVDEAVAQDIQNVTRLADDSKRIQRLSVDTRDITQRIITGSPGLSEKVEYEKMRATVRLILMTASQIVHEQDGVDLE